MNTSTILFAELTIPYLILSILGAFTFAIVFGCALSHVKSLCDEKKNKQKQRLKTLWWEYEYNIARFNKWRADHPNEQVGHPDAQSLLVNAMGPLHLYYLLSGEKDQKAWTLLSEHMCQIGPGIKKISMYDAKNPVTHK